MTLTKLGSSLVAIGSLLIPSLYAADLPGPKPIPATRPEAKAALERLKSREPRLPLPAPTDEERAEAQGREFGLVNNGRMRNLYLPADLRSRTTSRQKDPAMTLDYGFTVELFWIASRGNNCHYCLGHQETKLLTAGIEEPRIAALDADWSRFTAAERAAYALARKLTLRPDQITDVDIAAVEKHYKPLQVLEMVMLVARYNATNRWTDSLGIPQEGHRKFLTETPAEFQNAKSIVALAKLEDRQPPPSRDETLAQLAKCRNRSPRLPMLDEAAARQVVSTDVAPGRIPQWMRLLANFPVSGKGMIEGYVAAKEKGTLPAEMKAQIAWVAARSDSAWYATDAAMQRLRKLGYSDERIFALDQAAESPQNNADLVLAFTRKLTATPQRIEDADIAGLRKHYSDSQVAEIVYHVTQAAFFDRVTEAAALPLDAQE
jgi:alkylhydroperoxidase family enzyme